MKKILLIVTFLCSLNLYAKEERISIVDNDGHKTTIGLEAYKNAHGVLEVRVHAAGISKFLDRLNPTIAFGRDLDDNQKIDTWFFITDHGIEVEHIEGNDPLGRDILAQLILKKYPTSAKLYTSFATTTVLSYLLISAGEAKNVQAQYYQDWINLEEIKIRLERDMNSLSNQQVQFQYELLAQGYKSMADKMDHFAKREFWGWVSADVGFWLSGAALVKYGGAFLESKLGLAIEKQKTVLSDKFAKMTSMKIGQVEIAKLNLKMAVHSTIVAQVTKGRLLRASKLALKWPTKIIIGAKSEWQYIAMNVAVQTAAETSAHWNEVYDANPLMMAKNVLSNPDIQQDIAFMTTDTVLMTGVSKSLNTTKARFLASGFIGLHDSTMVNLVIKQEDDYKRVAFDTGWEAIVGNAQTQLDLKALETFEKLAQKNNNPRLKLIGYAITLIDQGAGYFLYAKAAAKVSAPNIVLVPVMVQS